jgi:acetyl esterase/lipase
MLFPTVLLAATVSAPMPVPSIPLPAATRMPAPPHTLLLWPEGAPGAIGTEDADRPTLTVVLPAADTRNGAAVLVCPGGGYGALADGHEGHDIAAWLNTRGLAAFILRYRLGPRYRHPSPLQDARRAMRLIRANASEWGVDPRRVGVWGFSAGGHLASTLGTHFDAGDPKASDPVARQSCRPDFMVLCYPVITMSGPSSHAGSRANLLGPAPSPALVELLSNERQVTPETPPTFLFHTTADTPVPPENSALFYLALRKAGVPAELHIYEQGPHGVGLALADPVLSSWPDRLAAWLRVRGVLDRRTP